MNGDDLRSGTWITHQTADRASLSVRRCRLEVTSGPDSGLVREFDTPVIRIGGRAGVDLLLEDRKVSGIHVEISLDENGYRLRDLESTNGTYIKGLRVRDLYLAPNTRFTVGQSELRFTPLSSSVEVSLWPDDRYQHMVGNSVPMRRLFAAIERCAVRDVTVLITGETGTGKELVAESVHRASPRADGPLVVLDCSAVPASLFENELFGHERGAFTDAHSSTPGAFERAQGGTLFLDEIGELPLQMQPKLLRAVESKTVRRIGGNEPITCDVRLIAATNRDLAVEVNRGRFRDDLFYRFAVARLGVPPLRERTDDIPLLVEHFLDELPGGREVNLGADFAAALAEHHWPGNVRELRNAVERAVLMPRFPDDLAASLGLYAAGAPTAGGSGWPPIDIDVPFKVAKKRFLDVFERRYMQSLMEHHSWNISAAARATGVDRMSIYKLLERLGLERPK